MGNHVLISQDLSPPLVRHRSLQTHLRGNIGLGDGADLGEKRDGGAEDRSDFSGSGSPVDAETITTARNSGPWVILENINHCAVLRSPWGLLSRAGLFGLLFHFLASTPADKLSAVTSHYCQCACF